MSFSLGGPGDILPPRSKTQTKPAVQESVPRDAPPRTTPDVAPSRQPTVLPQSVPASVTRLADRRPSSKREAVQSAIAASTGNVIPLPNIKAVTDALRTGQMTPGGAWVAPVAPSGVRPTGGPRPRGRQSKISLDALCTAVGIIEADRHGNSITLSANEGRMREVSGDELKRAAAASARLVKSALASGDATQDDVAYCQREYCKRARCDASHATGDVMSPPVSPPPAAPPADAPPDMPPSMLPPALPPVPSPDEPTDIKVRANPEALVKEEPKAPEGLSGTTKAALWVGGLVAAYLLFKKLSGVKVVGAAMAGVPLVADMGDDEEDEEDEDEADGDDGAEDAHETDSAEKAEE